MDNMLTNLFMGTKIVINYQNTIEKSGFLLSTEFFGKDIDVGEVAWEQIGT